MTDVIKYFVDPGDGNVFEIPAVSADDAVEKIKRDFRGSGEVRLIINVYRHLFSTPYIIKT